MNMKSVSASFLQDVLLQAQDLGIVEETIEVCGVSLTLRNLRPGEHQQVTAALAEVPELDFLMAHMAEHVSRSIVAINGKDLRGVGSVATEEEDAKGRKVKKELHVYLRENLIETWGREALTTVYRKVLEVMDKGDTESKKGVTFHIPEETDDEKLRRLLMEAREALQEIPESLGKRLLEEHGFLLVSDKEEREKAEAKIAALPSAEVEEALPPVAPVAPEPRKPVYQQAPQVMPGPPEGEELSSRSQSAAELEAMPGDPILPPMKPGVVDLRPRAKDTGAPVIDAKPAGGVNPRFQQRRALPP